MTWVRREVESDLLDDMIDAADLRCKFGAQLRDWGPAKENAVYRARKAGASPDVIRAVLIKWGLDPAGLRLIRDHFSGQCRCPRRRP